MGLLDEHANEPDGYEEMANVACKYTFRVGSRYPTSINGKIRWSADREHALKMARGFGATEFIELNLYGVILKTIAMQDKNVALADKAPHPKNSL